MFTNQHAFSEYLTLWNQFQYGHRERDVFLKELQERYPCDAKAFRKHYWSIPETTLVYYGLNPSDIFSILDQYAFPQLLHSMVEDALKNKIAQTVGECSNQSSSSDVAMLTGGTWKCKT